MKKERKDLLIIRLKRIIKEYLDIFCDEKSTPYICELKQTEEGKKDIEDFVINAFFNSDLSVSDALVEKENMLNPNYLTD